MQRSKKAAITAPTGNVNEQLNDLFNCTAPNIDNILKTGQNLTVPQVDVNFNDDQPNNFTQVSAHVEPTVANKIKIGGFHEIEKLAPKTNDMRSNNGGVEMISRDGRTYFVPASDRETQKITNFSKWETCFRVYASIFTQANPHRVAEIYQYIHTIHLASMSYQWENVAYYDYYFRKFMAENPQRSWGKMYTQLWSLSMRDPLRSGSAANNGSSFKNRQNSECCWRYNRNQCRKSNKDCKFEHRCSFCGIYNHTYLNCRKRRNDTTSSGDASSNGSNTHKQKNSHNKSNA